jgi:hypothetical protein
MFGELLKLVVVAFVTLIGNLREGGTISSVVGTLRDEVSAAFVPIVAPSAISFSFTTNAMMLHDFPKPIESASIPPLNSRGFSN